MRFCFCLLVCLSLLLSIIAFSANPPPKYHQIKKIEVGGDGGWDILTMDPANRRLYIAHSTRVTVVDVDKGTVAGEVANTPGVHGVAVVSRMNKGFASNGQDNTVTVFDLKTLKEVERVKVGTRPDEIIYDVAVQKVFVFNGGSNDATAIDPATNKVAGTVPLGGKPEFAVTDEDGLVFVNIEDKNEIVSFDPTTLAVKNHWPLAPGTGPSGLAIDRKNHRLFAACDNGMMVVLDSQTGKVIATPKIGQGPDGAVFNADQSLAFSPNGRDGTLTVIREESPDKFTIADTVATEVGSRTMALDPKTGNVYIATAKFGPPVEGQRRPPILPNTFAILVYGP